MQKNNYWKKIFLDKQVENVKIGTENINFVYFKYINFYYITTFTKI